MANGGSVGGAFQPHLDYLRQELQQRDPTLLSAVVALLAVLLTLGKEAVGGFDGCTAGGIPSLDWACADRCRGGGGGCLDAAGASRRETHLLYQPALLPEARGVTFH